MNTQTVFYASTDVTPTTDFVEITLDFMESVGGGDATSYPIGPRS
jgi:hypothetical protein